MLSRFWEAFWVLLILEHGRNHCQVKTGLGNQQVKHAIQDVIAGLIDAQLAAFQYSGGGANSSRDKVAVGIVRARIFACVGSPSRANWV